jgi:hypothetical protein
MGKPTSGTTGGRRLASRPDTATSGGLPWADCFRPGPNKQLPVRFKPKLQTALNINQPIGGLPELKKIQIKYGSIGN